jgi:hypothetical protein
MPAVYLATANREAYIIKIFPCSARNMKAVDTLKPWYFTKLHSVVF